MTEEQRTPPARILVVEDEAIVAMSIKDRLRDLGYEVAGVVSTGEDAVNAAEELMPDLILMDIVLKGRMDGVEAAGEIRRRLEIPVVYLTAYSDHAALKRAKITVPYGYILKPFEQRELLINIEIALYRHQMERRLRQSEQWLLATMRLLGCGVITSDVSGNITFLNSGAAHLTGWSAEEALGKRVEEVFDVSPETPVAKTLEAGIVIAKGSILTPRGATERAVDYSSVVLTDEADRQIGVVIVIHGVAAE
jgi:PAS domain S-box-containing protein